MNMQKFYASVRASLYKGILVQSDVDGINSILEVCKGVGVTDPHHVANILAQVHHETGGYMLPIKETVMPNHKDKNPSDEEVIRRLDNAFAAGKLPWVKTPYWRKGWFGRGQIQITHEEMYAKVGNRIGVNLVGNPNLALNLGVSAMIAVVGMSEGLFTGRKLGDYKFPEALDAEPKQNPRRIVNGVDGTDKEVARVHRLFYNALLASVEGNVPVTPNPKPVRNRSVIMSEIRTLLDELETIGN